MNDMNELRTLAEAATPGPWKAVSDPHFDSGLVYTSVQPVTADEDTMKPMAMMNGEYHVCRMSHTAAEWRYRYHRANAAYIAACSPDVILALLSECDALRDRVAELEGANQWRTIETAPADWSNILLFDPEYPTDWSKVFEGFFDCDENLWRDRQCTPVNPTQWMPLPAPPALSQGDQP